MVYRHKNSCTISYRLGDGGIKFMGYLEATHSAELRCYGLEAMSRKHERNVNKCLQII